MAEELIGEWTISQLLRFIKQQIDEHEKVSNPSQEWDLVAVNQKLTVKDQLAFNQSQTTVGAAGSASALPATPELYVKVLDPTGTVRLMPLYRSA